MIKKRMFLLLVLISILGISLPAKADIYTRSLALLSGGCDVFGEYFLFDPSLGELNSVQIHIIGEAEVIFNTSTYNDPNPYEGPYGIIDQDYYTEWEISFSRTHKEYGGEEYFADTFILENHMYLDIENEIGDYFHPLSFWTPRFDITYNLYGSSANAFIIPDYDSYFDYDWITTLAHFENVFDNLGNMYVMADWQTGYFEYTWTYDYTPVPEPATMLLLGSGLLGLAGLRRKFRKR